MTPIMKMIQHTGICYGTNTLLIYIKTNSLINDSKKFRNFFALRCEESKTNKPDFQKWSFKALKVSFRWHCSFMRCILI